MLTNLTIRNFKRFGQVEIELGEVVVFIGPNNSGKTTALQALALWEIGLRRWREKRRSSSATERTGVTVNRRDLVSIPISEANLLWRNLHTRDVQRTNGKQTTTNIRVDILVSGIEHGKQWQCGLEFDYSNDESFFVRPLRISEDGSERMEMPKNLQQGVAFLPPMSGLADREFIKQTGEIGFLIGQGRTAEVLRNLCYRLSVERPEDWEQVTQQMRELFGVILEEPRLVTERSEIVMSYKEENVRLDLASAGRGLQQTLLLLAYLSVNRGVALLLDEPDAHLEILRQRQIYQLLTETARKQGSQIIAASHSEVILNEAADRDIVVAFVGNPHRIDDRARSSQVAKSLRELGYEQYYQAEQKGWVLYLEGSTDLAILQAFAKILEHPASDVLQSPFVHYVQTNLPQKAKDHFYGLKEAKDNLIGFALFDRLDKRLDNDPALVVRMWKRREIENYLCSKATLIAWVRAEAELQGEEGLFLSIWIDAMTQSIKELTEALTVLGKDSPWSGNLKVSEEFFPGLFRSFYAKIALPNQMNKSDYHRLAPYVPIVEMDDEITQVLDELVAVSERAST